MIRYAIIDQDSLSRERISIQIAPRENWLAVGCADDCDSAMKLYASIKPDVFFITLSEFDDDKMQLAETLLEKAPHTKIIFVTNTSNRAVDAFAINASDYLVKPISYERMEQCLERVEQQLSLTPLTLGNNSAKPSLLAVKSLGKIELISINDIYWIHGACNYVELHLKDRMVLHREPLSQLLNFINNPQFVRVHRSSIVNLAKVRVIHSEEGRFSLIAMENGQEVKISHAYRKPLLERIHIGN